jgi:hypothetical protein
VFVLEVGQVVETNVTTTLTDVRSHDKFDDALKGDQGQGNQSLSARRQFFASVSAGSAGTQVLDSYGSTKEPNEPNHGGVEGGASRWFRIDVTADGTLVIDTVGSDIDTVLAVYQGASLFGLSLVASDDNSAPDGIRSLLKISVVAGQSLLVAVDGVGGAEGHITLNYALAIAPSIKTPPQGQSVNSGSSLSLQAQVEGTGPLAYQWFARRAGESSASAIAGATNAVLALNNVQVTDAGYFSLRVANVADAATSAEALLSVEAPLRFDASGSGVTNGVFTLTLSGKLGQSYVIQGSTDLRTWTSLQTNSSASGSVKFTDPGSAGNARRFYRAVPLE